MKMDHSTKGYSFAKNLFTVGLVFFYALVFAACSSMRGTKPIIATTPLVPTLVKSNQHTAVPTKLVTVEPPFLSPTAESGAEMPSPTSAVSQLAKAQLSGDVYILLRPVKPPFLLALGYLPAKCLLSKEDCPTIEIIHQDRDLKQPVLRQMPLVFSPDGETVWWNNDYQSKIFALDVDTKLIQPVAGDLPVITGEFQWSPDGRWVALAVQGNGPYDGLVMLLDRWGKERRIYLNSLSEVKFPIGWINERELIVRITKNGPPDDDPNGKWVEKRSWVAVLDVTTGQAREMLQGQFGVSPNALSPDHQWLAFSQHINGETGLFLRSLVGENTIDLKTDREFIGWSPDGQWLALRSTSGEVSVLRPDGSEDHAVLFLPVDNAMIQWSQDSQHLLLMEYTFDMSTGRDVVNLSLVTIDGGARQPIEFPGLNTDDYLIDNLYWKP